MDSQFADRNLVQAMQDSFMNQLVDFPTHNRGGLLDIILTNEPASVRYIKSCPHLSISDHIPIQFVFLSNTCWDETSQYVPDISKGNFNSFRDLLKQHDWLKVLPTMTVNTAWCYFKEIMDHGMHTLIPWRLWRTKRRPPWLTKVLLNDIKGRNNLFKHYKSSGSSEVLDTVNLRWREIRIGIREAKRAYEAKLSVTKNQRGFFGYVNNFHKGARTIGPLLDSSGRTRSGHTQMAEILNTYFASIFMKKTVKTFETKQSHNARGISDLIFYATEVEGTIKKMKPTQASGPDGISVTLLRQISDVVSVPLTVVFNMSMQRGELP